MIAKNLLKTVMVVPKKRFKDLYPPRCYYILYLAKAAVHGFNSIVGYQAIHNGDGKLLPLYTHCFSPEKYIQHDACQIGKIFTLTLHYHLFSHK